VVAAAGIAMGGPTAACSVKALNGFTPGAAQSRISSTHTASI
jgi:hypothetical protein